MSLMPPCPDFFCLTQQSMRKSEIIASRSGGIGLCIFSITTAIVILIPSASIFAVITGVALAVASLILWLVPKMIANIRMRGSDGHPCHCGSSCSHDGTEMRGTNGLSAPQNEPNAVKFSVDDGKRATEVITVIEWGNGEGEGKEIEELQYDYMKIRSDSEKFSMFLMYFVSTRGTKIIVNGLKLIDGEIDLKRIPNISINRLMWRTNARHRTLNEYELDGQKIDPCLPGLSTEYLNTIFKPNFIVVA
ncbi:MAG: hypothetical protein LBI69_00190 [Puniceicoccales bacterium]|nr:hypothetical protein [Puniceicoccales bacterium]